MRTTAVTHPAPIPTLWELASGTSGWMVICRHAVMTGSEVKDKQLCEVFCLNDIT